MKIIFHYSRAIPVLALMFTLCLLHLPQAQVLAQTVHHEGPGGLIYYEEKMDQPWYQMTWPGTHNSYSNYSDGYGYLYDYKLFVTDISTLNQYMSVKQQLKRGIRYLTVDIVTDADDEFCHGSCGSGKTDYGPVLQDIKDFLKDNPEEIVIISLDFAQHKRLGMTDEKDPGKKDWAEYYYYFIKKMRGKGLWDYVVNESILDPSDDRYSGRASYTSSKGDKCPKVSEIKSEWDAANCDDGWPTIRDMIQNNTRVIFLPDFLESQYRPNTGGMSYNKKEDANSMLPENTKFRKKSKASCIYVNPNSCGTASACKEDSKIANDGYFLYNLALDYRQEMNEYNEANSLTDDTEKYHLTAMELQFFDTDEKRYPADGIGNDKSVVEASNWLNNSTKDDYTLPNSLLFNTPYYVFNYDNDNINNTAFSNTGSSFIFSSDPEEGNYIFIREYNSRYFLKVNGTITNGAGITSDEDDKFNEAARWQMLYSSTEDKYQFRMVNSDGSLSSYYLIADGSTLELTTSSTHSDTYFRIVEASIGKIQWSFNGNLNADDGIYPYTGSNAISPTYGTSTFAFPGESYAEFNNVSNEVYLSDEDFRIEYNDGLFENSFTMSLWIKTTDTDAYLAVGRNWNLKLSSGSLVFKMQYQKGYNNGGDLDRQNENFEITSQSVNDGEWHLVNVIFSGKKQGNQGSSLKTKLYVDNILVDSDEDNANEDLTYVKAVTYNSWAGTFRIASGYVGAMKDLMLFQYTLTEDDLMEIYESKEKGLVASYEFEQNLSDGSGNNLHITTVTGSPDYIDNRLEDNGNCLYLGPNESITLPFAFDEEGSSFSFWVNKQPDGLETDFITTDNWKLRSEDNKFGLPLIGSLYYPATNGIADGSWHHVVFNMESANTNFIYTLYVDGDSIGSTTINTSAYTNSIQLALNGGYLDELQIYNYALSTDEVTALYDESDYADRTYGLIAFYPLAEDFEDDIHFNDASGTGTFVDDVVFTNALSLDGIDDYVDLGYYYNPSDYVDTVTVSFALKLPTTKAGQIEPIADMKSWGVRINANDQLELYGLFNGTEVKSYYDGNLYDGAWHEVIATIYKNSQGQYEAVMYLDGKALNLSTAILSSSAMTRTTNRNILAGSDGNGNFLKGQIANLQLWDRAFSAEEATTYWESNGWNLMGGLVAYYDFEEENGTVAADVMGNYDGTLYYSPEYVEDNGLGTNISTKVLRLNGSNHMDLNFNLNPSDYHGEMTVSMWMRSDDWQKAYEVLIGNGNWSLTRENSADYLRFYSWHNESRNLFGTSKVDDGLWHHIVITVHQSGTYQAVKRLYMDGEMEGWQDITNEINSTGNKMLLGKRAGSAYSSSTNWNFTGDLDEVRIYNRMLSEDEIADLEDETHKADILAKYEFEDNLNDSWMFNQHATSSGGSGDVTYQDNNMFASKVVRFDKEGYMILPFELNPSNYNDGQLTVDFWMNSSDYQPNAARGIANIMNWVLYFGTDGSLRVANAVDGTGQTIISELTSGWHHIAWINDQNDDLTYTMTIYVDGNEELEMADASILSQGYSSNWFGNNLFQSSDLLIEDLHIWGGEALSSEDIDALYRAKETPIAQYALNGSTDNTGTNGVAPANQGIDVSNGEYAIFDGADYLNVNFSFDPASYYQEFTISGWVNYGNISEDNSLFKDQDNVWSASISNEGLLQFDVKDTEGNSYTVLSQNSLKPGLWYHLAFTVEADAIYIYQDGERVSYHLMDTTIAYSTSAGIRIGENFSGYMSDVKVYNYALNGTDMEGEYSATSQGKAAIAYYKLNGNADDEFGNNGTAVNGVDFDTEDIERGQVAAFNGYDGVSDYIDLPDFSLDYTQGITLEGWVKFSSAFNAWENIIEFYTADGEELSLRRFDTYDGLRLVLKKGETKSLLTTAGNIVPDEWMHVAATVQYSATQNVTEMIIYVNGDSIDGKSTSKFTGGIREFTSNYIGKDFTGSLDEIRIWDKVLSKTEIQALAFTDALAHYTLDESSYTSGTRSVADYSGNDYDGTAYPESNTAADFFPGSSYADLDGSTEYFELPSGMPLTSSSGSVSAWVKTTQASDGMIFHGGVSSEYTQDADGYGGHDELHMNINASGNLFAGLYKKGVPAASNAYFSSVTTINDGEWHHVVMTWSNSDSIRLYIDGNSEGSKSHPGHNYDLEKMRLGRPGKDQRYFDGSMDDVRIYTSAITQDQINSLYNSRMTYSLEDPWEETALGSPALSGDAWSFNGTFTVNAAGNDIWNTNDQGHYVYQSLNADGEIVAKVTSLENTNSWAKAGLMIRESLAANSKYVSIVATPSNGTNFQYRSSTGGSTGGTNFSGITAPVWFKLVRTADTYIGYYSTDGSNWVYLSYTYCSMSADIYVGMAVTSHNTGALATAIFEDVKVTQSSGGAKMAFADNLEEEPVGKVIAYPNPASDILNVLLPEREYDLSLIDLMGKVQQIRESASGQIQLDLANLPSGLYILRIESDAGSESHQIMVR